MLDICLERDGNDWIACYTSIPLYGIGNTKGEALQMLNREVESLRADLAKDDLFTDDWFQIKKILLEA